MGNQIVFISVMLGLFIFLIIVTMAAVLYQKSGKNMRYAKENPDDWLFHDFYLKVYGAFFGMKDPDEVAVNMGINIEKYYQSCALTRTTPNPKKLVANHIYAFAVLFICLVLCFLASPLFIPVGGIMFIYLVYYEQQRLNQKAEGMRIQIANELPRFLDLLQSELQVGLPIETAIYVLCERMDTLLSREFQDALMEMELGVSGWQQAIERVAAKYNVETLSDFVLDVCTSYRKGVSVANAVTRKAKDVKQTHLLGIKERAGKTTNTILIPVAIFQFVPLFAFLMIPILFQTSQGFF